MSEVRGITEGIRSTASIQGHPLHPMLIPFPVASLVGVFLTDVAYAGTGDAFWARASVWLLGAGVVMGLIAGAVGSIDFTANGRIREYRESWLHAGGNAVALILAAINLGIRAYYGPALTGGLFVLGGVLAALVAAILVITMWLGQELVYRYGVAVLGGVRRARLLEPRRAA